MIKTKNYLVIYLYKTKYPHEQYSIQNDKPVGKASYINTQNKCPPARLPNKLHCHQLIISSNCDCDKPSSFQKDSKAITEQ